MNEGLAKHVQAPGRSEHTLSSFGDGDGVQSHVTPSKRKQHVEHCESMGRHGDHSSAGTAAGSSRQTQPQPRPASKVGPRAVSSRGSFGLATSPCAKVLEAHDTGDKVTCPVCHKGMDHWKSGQRQQVIAQANKLCNMLLSLNLFMILLLFELICLTLYSEEPGARCRSSYRA